MNDASGTYFAEVQRHLDEIGQPVALSADERDIVDDYATQDFGARECADQIARARTQPAIKLKRTNTGKP
jgi:hypothetical protein